MMGPSGKIRSDTGVLYFGVRLIRVLGGRVMSVRLNTELLRLLQLFERSDGKNILIHAPFDRTPKNEPVITVAGYDPNEIHQAMISLRNSGKITNTLRGDGATHTGIYFARLTDAGRRYLAAHSAS